MLPNSLIITQAPATKLTREIEEPRNRKPGNGGTREWRIQGIGSRGMEEPGNGETRE